MSTQPPPIPPHKGGVGGPKAPQYGPSQQGWVAGQPTQQPWAPPPVTAAYAGFWVRFVAYIIDSFVVGIPLGLLVSAAGGAAAVIYVLGFLVSIAYFVYFWSTSGQTLGQKAVNIRVVGAENGAIITPGQAGIRYVGLLISTWLIFLGLIWVAIDPRKQGWHDKMANTLVIPAP